MRLFIAIPLPKILYPYCRHLQNCFEGLKKTVDFHITLQFLGNNIHHSAKIIMALRRIQKNSFEIKTGKVLLFKNEKGKQGIWIECGGNKELDSLAEEIHTIMKPLGFIADKPFKAHITLGRYQQKPGKKPETINRESQRFRTKKFSLIQSSLTPRGSVYKTLADFRMI